MRMSNRYPIPAKTCRVEDEIKRSRFITNANKELKTSRSCL